MNIFDFALELVLKHEGGYVNHPRDPGGETKYGISDRRDGLMDGHADIDGDKRPDVAIRHLTTAQAAEVYRRDYWLACKCDQLPAPIAVFLFDTAVNCGNRAAVRMLQRAMSVRDDGVIGPITIGRTRTMASKAIVRQFADQRMEHYRRLPTWNTFGRGWSRRVDDVMLQISELDGAA